MNILRSLPSPETFRRHGAKVALASALGIAACGPSTNPQPTPTPEQTTHAAHGDQIPSCTIVVHPAGPKTYEVGVSIENGFKPTEYGVKNVSYYFGDGDQIEDQPTTRRVLHTYVVTGNVTVNATVQLDITPAANLPFKPEDAFQCVSRPLTVR